MADIALILAAGPKPGVFVLIDNATKQPVPGATITNQAVGANSNPEFATFAIDPANPGVPVATPVASGAGTIIFTADVAYVDPGDNSNQTASLSVAKNFTVAPGPDGVSLDVQF